MGFKSKKFDCGWSFRITRLHLITWYWIRAAKWTTRLGFIPGRLIVQDIHTTQRKHHFDGWQINIKPSFLWLEGLSRRKLTQALLVSTTMASHSLAIAKASLAAGMIRPDPVSVSRTEVSQLHMLLQNLQSRCSHTNIQVWRLQQAELRW